ncbi:MAG TPA: hypothetical protein VD865_05040 [Stenotrophomonas sp.]|nr:hypothetical protein [Stenotrophomonas sp.]
MSAPKPSKWTPWAALAAALSAEALHHQFLSDLLRFRCEWGRPALGWAVTTLALLWMAAGCLVSRTALSEATLAGLAPAAARNRRFIVQLGWLACAVLAIAVLWQMLAVLLLPSCP